MRRKQYGAGLVLLALWGWVGSSGAGESAVRATAAPNLDAYRVEKVAILALANTTGDREADAMAGHMIQAITQTGKYHVTPSEQFAQDAKRVGMEAEYTRMVSTWQKKRKADEDIVKKVLLATGYDAVVGLEVTRWEEMKIDPMREGTSDTSVGVLVGMFASDGVLLWTAKDSRTERSIPYLPSFNQRATDSGEAITTATGAVPEPPDIEKVAAVLARKMAAAMPVLKGKDASQGSGGKPSGKASS